MKKRGDVFTREELDDMARRAAQDVDGTVHDWGIVATDGGVSLLVVIEMEDESLYHHSVPLL